MRHRAFLPRVRDGTRALYAGVALGLLLGTSLRGLLSSLFFESLATLRLNATAFWTLAILAPALAPRLPAKRWPLALAGLATAALPFARFTDAYIPTAAAATGLALLALAQAGDARRVGALVGLAASGALLLLDASHDPLLSPWGALALLGLAIAAMMPERDAAPAGPARVTAGVAWAALLAAQAAFLAAPFVVARHAPITPAAAAIAGLVGLAAGATVLRGAGRWLPAAAALGLLDLAFAQSLLLPLSLAVVQAALGSAAARLPRPDGVTLGATLTPALFALLFFAPALGAAEWRVAMPFLVLLPLGFALPRPRLRGWSARVAAPLVIAAILLAPASGRAPTVDAHEGDEIIVASWNVRQGFGNRGALDPALYADALREIGPDILILQEADTAHLSSGGLDVARYLARELGLHVVVSGSGIAILSRFPTLDVAPREEWTSAAALDVHGQTLWVQGVHLARSREERAEQVDALLASANATPGARLVAGDLNSCPTSTCFGGRPSDGIHERLATGFTDAWSVHHDPADPTGNTHPAWNPSRRIDVIAVRGLDVLASGPVRDERTALGSDHLPVVATLRLPS